MERSQMWLFGYTDALWRYVRATYDGVGSAPLAAVFHQGRYGGGHPATVFDADHDHRNVIDIGLDNWSESDPQPRDIIAHEIAHIVEASFGGVKRSPSFPIWMRVPGCRPNRRRAAVAGEDGRPARRVAASGHGVVR